MIEWVKSKILMSHVGLDKIFKMLSMQKFSIKCNCVNIYDQSIWVNIMKLISNLKRWILVEEEKVILELSSSSVYMQVG